MTAAHENKAFTARAIAAAQRMRPGDPLLPPIVEYLFRMNRLGIGPGDMWWVVHPVGPPQVFVPLVPVERAAA